MMHVSNRKIVRHVRTFSLHHIKALQFDMSNAILIKNNAKNSLEIKGLGLFISNIKNIKFLEVCDDWYCRL